MRKFSMVCVLTGLCLAAGLSACGSDDPSETPDAGTDSQDKGDATIGTEPDAANADAAGDHEAGASGLDASSSAEDASLDIESFYQCKPPEAPNGTVTLSAECCDGLGTCQEASAEGASGAGIGDCDATEDLRCVTADTEGGDPPPSCRFELDDGTDFEGRCIPECLTRGTSSSLEQRDCDSGFVCVPCYSPVTGEDTGTCRRNGDEPAEKAPEGFADCGDSLGYCISQGLAGESGANLPQLSCGEGHVCAPRQRVLNPSDCATRCQSLVQLPGACTPGFLIPDTSNVSLPQDVCEEGEVCAPCVDPLQQTRTGACD